MPEPTAYPLSGRSDAPIPVLLAIKGLNHGGAERLVVDSARAGDHHRFRYEVAFVLAGSDALVGELDAASIPVTNLGAGHSLDLRWIVGFRRLLVNGRYAVVHFHLPYTAAVGRLVVLSLPRHLRPITLYTEHCLWNKVSPLVKMLNRATVRRDGALIAVSEAAKSSLPRGPRDMARVVVHGIDPATARQVVADRESVRAQIRKELAVPDGDLLVITVANLRSEKGYDVLLDVAHQAGLRGLPLRFAAAGQGDLEEELAERHQALGLGERFRLLGHRRDALALLAAADIVVLPSHQDGLPVVLMEALSVGATVVVTEVGGAPEVITTGVNGILVPPGDPTALVDALALLSADADLRLRLGRTAFEKSGAFDGSDAFDVARASREIEGLYEELIAGGRRADAGA